MASGDNGNLPVTPGESSKAETKSLDLSDAHGHASAIEYIRNNVVLVPGGERPDVLQLEVKLPSDKRVTLYMNTANHYILGFKGEDKVYLLRDADSGELKKTLVNARVVSSADQVEILSLGGEHPTLGTLGRTFSFKDLSQASKLGDYSTKSKRMTYEDLKGPLALLVRMIAESSRIKSMEWAMRDIYYGGAVKAQEAIQSWKDACGIIELSDKYFAKYLRAHGVEKLDKRGDELRQLLQDIKDSHGQPIHDEKAFVQDILDGRYKKTGKTGFQIDRVADMARELNIRKAEDLTKLVTACQNKVAVEAAKDGVAVPRTTPMPGGKKNAATV